MSNFAGSLARTLPKPKYSGEEESVPLHARQTGPRVIGADSSEAGELIHLAGSSSTALQLARPDEVASKPKGNALAIRRDESGRIQYDAIARQGHSESRIIQTSFKDLIPLRQRADVELTLAMPSNEQIEQAKEKTAAALAKIVTCAVAAQRPKLVQGTNRPAPTFVRYTPANQMGNDGQKQERIIKIVNRQIDPMAPPKFKHKKIPRGPPSPPPPILHSPPRKLTAADQAAWRIPPPVSNWKNPKGYTVPLDKRLAADGRGLQDVTISDKFAHFQEALYMADRHAREQVRERAQMQQRLAEKEKLEKEDHLRQLAQKARQDRQTGSSSRRRHRSRSVSSRSSRDRSSSRSHSESSNSGYSSDSDSDVEARDRDRARQERRRDNQREMRQQRMGTERRARVLARESGRDISEQVALGVAKPTKGETMYDSRLFNRDSGLAAGFNEDQAYDKPLFAAQDAVRSIYRPTFNADEADGADDPMDEIEKSNRFDVLGKAKTGFQGADGQQREGPVQFRKENDPFDIERMIEDVQKGGGGGK